MSPSQNPTTSTTDQPGNQTSIKPENQPDQTALAPVLYEIAIGTVVAFCVGLGLLVYFKKHKR